MPTLREFAHFINNAPSSRDRPRVPPPCQPPLRAPKWAAPSTSHSTSGDPPGILVAAFEVDDLKQELLRVMSLASKRAAACASSGLCAHLSAHLHAATLAVRIEDATFENAAFVGRLPNLQRLYVQGEASQPDGLHLVHLRTLDRIAIDKLGFEAALFLGAALSGGEHSFRMSTGTSVLLPPLRTRERINLFGRGLTDSDLAALLGALSLNLALKELNINNNPAPTSNGLRAAMVQALPWEVLRHQPCIKIGNLLQACNEKRTL